MRREHTQVGAYESDREFKSYDVANDKEEFEGFPIIRSGRQIKALP